MLPAGATFRWMEIASPVMLMNTESSILITNTWLELSVMFIAIIDGNKRSTCSKTKPISFKRMMEAIPITVNSARS